MPTRCILILGGTGEAAALAKALIDRFGDRIDLTTSLAGRTIDPAALAGKTRVGGFGGATGLSDYLRQNAIDLVIDATHPFAAQISANAATACTEVGIPRLLLARPAWHQEPGDQWIDAQDLADAAAILEASGARRVWLTIGGTELSAFARLEHRWFLIRTIDPPARPPPLKRYEIIYGRGPFTLENERAVIYSHRIDTLVTKASGGESTYAKIVAARTAGIPVVMIRRPEKPGGDVVESVEEAVDWIESYISPAPHDT